MSRFTQRFATRLRGAAPVAKRLWQIAWPLLPIGAAASLLVYPIVSVDSAVLTTQTFNDFVVPHWPPLYPLFVRTIVVLTECVLWLLGGPLPHGYLEPNVTAASLKVILLFQHGMAIVASAYAASQFRIGLVGKRIVATLLYLNPFTLVSVHSILSEALMAVFLLAAFGAAIPILLYRDVSLRRGIWFLVWVTLATLSRYAALAFAFLLPLGLALQGIGDWLSRDKRQAKAAISRVAIALIGVLCVQIAASLVATSVMKWRDVEPRSGMGRAFVYRLAEASLSMSPGGLFMSSEEHAQLIRRLKSAVGDEVLLRTIDIIATTSEYSWVPAFNSVQADISACKECCLRQKRTREGVWITRVSNRCRWAETDRRLNQVVRHALLSFDPILLRDTAQRTLEFLFPFLVTPPYYPNLAWLSWHGLGAGWDSTGPARERFDGPAMAERFLWQPGTHFPLVSNLAYHLRGIMVICTIGVLGLLLPLARQAAPLALGLLGTMVIYGAMVSLITVYIPRYGLPIDLSALFAMVVAVIGVLEARRQSPATHSEAQVV